MKLTKSQLKQIIEEELENILNEDGDKYPDPKKATPSYLQQSSEKFKIDCKGRGPKAPDYGDGCTDREYPENKEKK